MFSKQDYLGYFDLIRATETKMRDNAELLLKKITDKIIKFSLFID